MSHMHAAIGHLNRMYGDPQFLKDNREALQSLYAPSADGAGGVARSTETMLSESSPLGEAARGVDSGRVAEILLAMPPTIIEAQRAAVHANLQREAPYGMTFAWVPAYDHEVSVWESPPSTTSPGWITVLIRGRYPGDAHPLS